MQTLLVGSLLLATAGLGVAVWGSMAEGERMLVSGQRRDTVSVSVAPGETSRFDNDFDRQVSGSDNRLTYLLYVGESPEDPAIENSYRDVYVWVGGS